MNILYFIIGVGVGMAIEKMRSDKHVEHGERRAVERTAAWDKKEVAKGRVMDLFAAKSEIANDDVQKLLEISDATATNYLSELETEGKISQIGDEGSGVRYRKNG